MTATSLYNSGERILRTTEYRSSLLDPFDKPNETARVTLTLSDTGASLTAS